MSTTTDLVFVWVVQVDLISVWGIESELISVWRWNWFFRGVGGRNWLGFCTRGENHLFLAWACKLTRILCGWPILTWFQCGDRTWLDSSVGWNTFGGCVGGRKCLHFSVVDRHWFGFFVAVENDLVLASGSKLTGFLCRGTEIDLMLEWGSKLTWFQWWGRN